MARFRLQPCLLRESRLVPTSDPPQNLDWKGLVALFSKAERVSRYLRQLRQGCYVGTIQRPNQPFRVFVLFNPNSSTSVAWRLRDDPAFAASLLSVYRVEEMAWDSVVEEPHVEVSEPPNLP